MFLAQKARRLLLFLLWLGSFSLSQAQNGFLIPKKISNPYQTQLWLSNYQDLIYLEKNLPKFYHIETVKVDGTVDIAKAAALCEKLTLLQEVQLHRFEGIISDEDLQHLEWVPEVSIYIPEKRVDATVLNEAWGLLSQVSLRFEVVPDNFEFLKGWKQLRSLSVLGDMNREEANALIEIVAKHMPKLKHLEISLVSVLELPPKISACKQLRSIRIVDGSDWAQGKEKMELGEFVMPLRVGSTEVSVGNIKTDKNLYMPLKWVSSRPYLNRKETNYLKSIFPDVEESEILHWIEEEEEAVLDFAESESLKPFALKPLKSGNEFLPGFLEGNHSYVAHTKSDQVFLGDAEWALLVPKGSLQFENGKPYDGVYHVSVANWSDPEAMIAAGMPMTYDSNRMTYALNPSFLVNITIMNEDRTKSLQLKPGYFAEVHVSRSLNELDRFYAWEDKLKKWQHFYDYDYRFDYDVPPAKIDFYQFYKGAVSAQKRGDFLAWTLDDAFETEGFNYLMPPHLFEMRLGKTKGDFVLDPPMQAKEIRRIVRGKNQIGIRVLPRNKQQKSDFQELLIFDRTHSLFPELKAFESYRLAFKTQMTKEQIVSFFKDRNWIDVRIVYKGNTYYLELRSHRQIWTIALTLPSNQINSTDAKERFKVDKEFHKRFAEYSKRRDLKSSLWNQMRKSRELTETQRQLAVVLGSGNVSRKKTRFLIQSFGSFALAHPVATETASIELILCELGKIPIDVKRVALSYEMEPYTSMFPVIPTTKQIPVNLNKLRYLMAESKNGDLYYLNGESLRSMQIKDQTLTYIELKPLKGNPQNSADWLKEMSVKTTKKRKK